jgi:DNA invertase Pin-like site-specific DNA recombinase
VSTGEQVVSGLSLESQHQKLEDYCQTKSYELLQVYTDEGVSGGDPIGQREQGARLARKVMSSDAGGVVAVRLDRLFRDALDCLECARAWRTLGVSLHLLDFGGETIDTSTAVGGMFLTMAAGFAEMERRLASERTIAALAAKKARGEQTGRVPFGHTLGPDGLLVPDPPALAVLQGIRDARARGLSWQKITDDLNARQVPPPQAYHGGAQGSRWHLTTVYRLGTRS